MTPESRLYTPPLERLETLFGSIALALLLLLTHAWDAPGIIASSMPVVEEGAPVEPDTTRQALFVALFLLIVGVGVRTRGLRSLLSVPLLFVPVLAWCWLSVTWAIEPGAAVRRIGLTTIVVLSICYCVKMLTYRQVLGVLSVCFLGILLAHWVALATLPFARHLPDEIDKSLIGAWRGIQKHKNETGAFLAVCTIFFLHESARTRSLLGAIAAVASIVFLIGSSSKTSLGLVPLALLAGGAAVLSYRSLIARRAMIVMALLAVAVSLPFLDTIALTLQAVFEDPAALTGRVQIWPVLMQYVMENPAFGAGYGSFWGLGELSPIIAYTKGWMRGIDHAHNGYVELLIHTGLPGLLLALVFLVWKPLRIIFTRPLQFGVSRSLIGALLVFNLLHNVLETTLLNRANGAWVIMVIAYALLAGGLRGGSIRDESTGRNAVQRIPA